LCAGRRLILEDFRVSTKYEFFRKRHIFSAGHMNIEAEIVAPQVIRRLFSDSRRKTAA